MDQEVLKADSSKKTLYRTLGACAAAAFAPLAVGNCTSADGGGLTAGSAAPNALEPVATVTAPLQTINDSLFVDGGVQIKGPSPWADVTAFGATPQPASHVCSSSDADQSAAINAAISAVAPTPDGGVVSRPTGGIVFFPSGVYCIQNSINIQGGVNIQGANRQTTLLEFFGSGSTAAPIIETPSVSTGLRAAYIAVRDIALEYVGQGGLANSKCIDLADTVYFDIANVACWNSPTTNTTSDSVIGIHVRSCNASPVPPIGYGHISNFIAYSLEATRSDEGGTFTNSRGILLDGSGGGTGCTASQVVSVSIDGYGDIENFQDSIEFKDTVNSTVSGSYWLGAGDQGIKFTSSAYNHVSDARIGYTTNWFVDSGAICNQSTGVGCAVWVDTGSFDNVIEHPDFYNPNNNAVLDQGTRTVWMTTGDGTQATVFPSQVNVGRLVIGGGTPITGHLSGTNVADSGIGCVNAGANTWIPGPSSCTGSLAQGACSSVQVSVPGAATGDTALASFSDYLAPTGLVISAQAFTNTVYVNVCNFTGSTLSFGNGSVRADVWHH
jgi:pectate lyase-like protein